MRVIKKSDMPKVRRIRRNIEKWKNIKADANTSKNTKREAQAQERIDTLKELLKVTLQEIKDKEEKLKDDNNN